jgi:hypothetical protein
MDFGQTEFKVKYQQQQSKKLSGEEILKGIWDESITVDKDGCLYLQD